MFYSNESNSILSRIVLLGDIIDSALVPIALHAFIQLKNMPYDLNRRSLGILNIDLKTENYYRFKLLSRWNRG